jgi:hypothetical protein
MTNGALALPTRTGRRPETGPALPPWRREDRQQQHLSNWPVMQLAPVFHYGNRRGPHPRLFYTRPVRIAGHAKDGTDELPGLFVPQGRLAVQLSTRTKGRIERSFKTAQDRLVKGLRRVGAKDLETANAYLEQGFSASVE